MKKIICNIKNPGNVFFLKGPVSGIVVCPLLLLQQRHKPREGGRRKAPAYTKSLETLDSLSWKPLKIFPALNVLEAFTVPSSERFLGRTRASPRKGEWVCSIPSELPRLTGLHMCNPSGYAPAQGCCGWQSQNFAVMAGTVTKNLSLHPSQ